MQDKILLENDENVNPLLLNTIKVPQNMHYLTDKLPIPNYDPIKTRISNKMDYIGQGNETMQEQSYESSWGDNSKKK